MSGTLRMYQDFFKKSWKFRKEIRQHLSWMKQYTRKKGYALNPHRMYLTNLIIWLEENKRLYQRQICPCFEASDNEKINRQLICPCSFCSTDIEEHGSCHCGLFGRGDFSSADFKSAERKVMREYRIPLKWINNTILDTRNQTINSLRNLPVPDAMHQFKQARNEKPSLDFQIILDNEQSARNIKAYIAKTGISSTIIAEDNAWRLNINPKKA